ncbi:hypothetical protein ONS96_008927 [Cadophora gregata f. sp. sojae]|nr:hypothetical protein ONS96_008927 [Cadophora gregata f. sp. sojae]
MLGPVSMALNLGACAGPVVGGWVAFTSGSFEWVFWALVIVGGILLSAVAIFLPETSRAIVSNGDRRGDLHWWEQSIWTIVSLRLSRSGHDQELQKSAARSKVRHEHEQCQDRNSFSKRFGIRNPLACLLVVFHYDTFLTLWIHASFYTVDYAIVAAVPDIFEHKLK